MAEDFISLFVIALVALACPIAARLVPGKLVPETVFLLIGGMVLGPHLVGVIHLTGPVDLLSELGLAFLFLLAGYEINPSSLTGSQGKRGLATWAVSIVLAFVAVRLSPDFSASHIDGVAVAIAMTTTALGTLLPILKERGLSGTPVGNAILSYGTWGELCPVLAMAILLSARSTWQTVVILLLFLAVAVLAAVIPSKMHRAGSKLFAFAEKTRHTNSQTLVRAVVALLVGLVALSAVFELDIVLGAFAAGFVLRYIVPEGDHELERKLEGMAYGFFIPLFFIVSGANIDIMGVFTQPTLLVMFIVLLLLIRALPIFIAQSIGKASRALLNVHERLTVSLYCTTALPIIVAVTAVAVNAGAMTSDTAGTLVAAGAVTVFLMPLLASIVNRYYSHKEPFEQ
ncbi:MAG TPA: cation:proton antiporter [Candidatus Aphodovivens excrementavium]|nr:cation:proton antiporter [Candidatus Aphodovivens excrementavium]